jgi:hypothetical protein
MTSAVDRKAISPKARATIIGDIASFIIIRLILMYILLALL